MTFIDGCNEAEVAEMPDYGHLLYARGYVLCEQGRKVDLGAHWASIDAGDYVLTWDRRQPLAKAESGDNSVLVLGRAIHLGDMGADLGEIAEMLVKIRSRSRADFLLELDQLSGRYVVIDSEPQSTRIQTDATAMRSAYYANGGKVVSSHARLAADLMGKRVRSKFNQAGWLARTKAWTYPGRFSEWENVFLLTPNTELDVGSGSIYRLPLEPIRETYTSQEAAARILPLMQGQLVRLGQDNQLLVSLTGGLDSRVTLALTRPVVDRCTYFTYHRPYLLDDRQSSRIDVEVAEELSTRFGLLHKTLSIDGNLLGGPMSHVLAKNTARPHARVVAATYRENLPSDRLHIRSNVYEIGRAFYRTGRNPKLPELTAYSMADSLVRKSSAEEELSTVEAFQDWIDVSGFEVPAGFDAWDIFYWEHRMSAWLNAVMIESDIAHDTYTLINCRAILRLFLSVPMAERRSGAVFNHLVSMSWPDVFDIPVNGKPRKAPALKTAGPVVMEPSSVAEVVMEPSSAAEGVMEPDSVGEDVMTPGPGGAALKPSDLGVKVKTRRLWSRITSRW